MSRRPLPEPESETGEARSSTAEIAESKNRMTFLGLADETALARISNLVFPEGFFQTER
jgi:hypothetical protein